jgi:ketose-bisphosphate aldolase
VKSIKDISDEYQVNVAIHLDHAATLVDVDAALESGFTSIMFDGSKLPYEKNVALTQKTIQKAAVFGASTEAELGIIKGKEEDIESNITIYPTIEQVNEFISITNVDFFAPAIGTVHGYYQKNPIIQWDLVNKLVISCQKPLVLHGGTGLDDNVIKQLIELGFRKINYATGIRSSFLKGLIEGITEADDLTKPQEYLKDARESVRIYIRQVLDNLMR